MHYYRKIRRRGRNARKMNEFIKNCTSMYDKLDRLLESDYTTLASSLKGEIYDGYRDLLIEEKEVLKQSKQAMQQSSQIINKM